MKEQYKKKLENEQKILETKFKLEAEQKLKEIYCTNVKNQVIEGNKITKVLGWDYTF